MPPPTFSESEDLGWAPSTPVLSLKTRAVVFLFNCSLCTCRCVQGHLDALSNQLTRTRILQFSQLAIKGILAGCISLLPFPANCPVTSQLGTHTLHTHGQFNLKLMTTTCSTCLWAVGGGQHTGGAGKLFPHNLLAVRSLCSLMCCIAP